MNSNADYILGDDEYFNPKLVIENDEEKEKKLNELLDPFKLNINQIERLRKMLAQELKYGLENNIARPSLFPMFNTFVTRFPTGEEVGECLAVDIGGTNLRVIKYSSYKDPLTGKNKASIINESYNVTSEHRQSNGKKFFDYLASCIQDFVGKKFDALPSDGERIPLGFTFSFGFDQLAIDKGKVTSFGIGTNLPDVIGKDPVKLFQQSIDSLNIPVKVVVLANDVTTTFITGKFQDPETKIGFILGSGTNIGYVEDVANFGKVIDPVKTYGYQAKEIAINTEFCVFGDDGCMDFCKNKYDFILDKNSLFPHDYTYEKVVGGAYLGELFRFVLVDLIKQNLILGGDLKASLNQKGALLSSDISRIEAEVEKNRENGQPSPMDEVRNLFTGFGYTLQQLSPDCCRTIVYLCQLISIRAALFCTIPLSVFVDHLPEKEVKVCVDGSLYKKHPRMHTLFNQFMSVLSPKKTCSVFHVDGGSAIGAAMLAAVYLK